MSTADIHFDKTRQSFKCRRCINGLAVLCGFRYDGKVCINCGAEVGVVRRKGRKISGPNLNGSVAPSTFKAFRSVIEAVSYCLRGGKSLTSQEIVESLKESGFKRDSIAKALMRHPRFVKDDSVRPHRYSFEPSVKYGRWGNAGGSSNP